MWETPAGCGRAFAACRCGWETAASGATSAHRQLGARRGPCSYRSRLPAKQVPKHKSNSLRRCFISRKALIGVAPCRRPRHRHHRQRALPLPPRAGRQCIIRIRLRHRPLLPARTFGLTWRVLLRLLPSASLAVPSISLAGGGGSEPSDAGNSAIKQRFAQAAGRGRTLARVAM